MTFFPLNFYELFSFKDVFVKKKTWSIIWNWYCTILNL